MILAVFTDITSTLGGYLATTLDSVCKGFPDDAPIRFTYVRSRHHHAASSATVKEIVAIRQSLTDSGLSLGWFPDTLGRFFASNSCENQVPDDDHTYVVSYQKIWP